MAQKNNKLNKARAAKNDEFYTRLSDIESELNNYWNPTKTKINYFKDKIVYCNCDDPSFSKFYEYFKNNYDEFDIDGKPCGLGIKKLITTYFNNNGPAYKTEYWKDSNGEHKVKTLLAGNGDFRNQECIDILDSADIICTNPPFSLYREYMNLLQNHNKKFLIIGPKMSCKYPEVLPYFKKKNLFTGYTIVNNFTDPSGNETTAAAYWFTNIRDRSSDDIQLVCRYYNDDGTVNSKNYPKYDNFDIIDCEKVVDIPKDYFKEIGVPFSFFKYYNPEQFVVLGCSDYLTARDPSITKLVKGDVDKFAYVNGVQKFARIFIKRKYKDDDKTILNTDCDNLEKNYFNIAKNRIEEVNNAKAN